MPENSKPQSVTIIGGKNVASTETKKPRGRPPGSTKPEKTKEPEPETPEE